MNANFIQNLKNFQNKTLRSLYGQGNTFARKINLDGKNIIVAYGVSGFFKSIIVSNFTVIPSKIALLSGGNDEITLVKDLISFIENSNVAQLKAFIDKLFSLDSSIMIEINHFCFAFKTDVDFLKCSLIAKLLNNYNVNLELCDHWLAHRSKYHSDAEFFTFKKICCDKARDNMLSNEINKFSQVQCWFCREKIHDNVKFCYLCSKPSFSYSINVLNSIFPNEFQIFAQDDMNYLIKLFFNRHYQSLV